MGYEQERRREEKCGERNVMVITRIGIDYERLYKFYKSNSEVRIIFFQLFLSSSKYVLKFTNKTFN